MEIQEVVNWNVITVRVAILLWTDVTHAAISSLSFALKPNRRGRGTTSHGMVSIEGAKKMGSVAASLYAR